MVKATGWVVDMRHYIDEDTGDLPEVIPERVLSLAIFFGAIGVLTHTPTLTNALPIDDFPQQRCASECRRKSCCLTGVPGGM
jgi:hypothetical protein